MYANSFKTGQESDPDKLSSVALDCFLLYLPFSILFSLIPLFNVVAYCRLQPISYIFHSWEMSLSSAYLLNTPPREMQKPVLVLYNASTIIMILSDHGYSVGRSPTTASDHSGISHEPHIT